MHYIQVVSTFHGLSNMIRIGEYLHYCKKIIKDGDTAFEVPITIERLDPGVKVSAQIGNILNGSTYNIMEPVEIENIDFRQTGVISSEDADIPEIMITYNNGQLYRFGALAVNKSMAHIGDKKFFRASPLAPTLPIMVRN